ncbi:Homeobox-like domain-containing protein [Dioscorea alata]|uniref:Homeobox-like domain-containing protein n=1 Tax=Dioscorea alata TaxID=55571 RepID=A0ACB7W9W7_DIOAL|nr:Homeobox-like domain-containing protein [Dioscorea alata]
MATAAFRSTTKRSSIGRAGQDTASSAARRRSRSLSRGPSRFPPSPPEPSELPTPRGKFVNKARGSGFPEISLDDLADEYFKSKFEDEITPPDRRSSRRMSEISPRMENGEINRQRGRSVSRRGVDGKGFANGKKEEGFLENSVPRRRQRSLSVARHRCSDSESYSSTLTDDEARDACNNNNKTEKIIRASYSQKMQTEPPTGNGEGTDFYNAMRKELRNAVEEIRTKLEKVSVRNGTTALANDKDMQSKTSSTVHAIAQIRRKFTTEMEQSEKRKQELLAELAAEEERGHELTKIVRELLPSPKQAADMEKPSQSRRKSKDRRTRMSQCLTEEAEKYFEDFLSNVEDTDISSFDGERSDTSSGLGASGKLSDSRMQQGTGEMHAGMPTAASSLPVVTDGVVLPWLQWEASSKSPPSFKSKVVVPTSAGKNLFPESQEQSPALGNSNHFTSSRGSWSPECNGNSSVVSKEMRGCQSGEVGSHSTSRFSISSSKGSSFDMDEYLFLQHSEDLLFESLRQRQRIDSGGLILCTRSLI